jgi:hypothetical protein
MHDKRVLERLLMNTVEKSPIDAGTQLTSFIFIIYSIVVYRGVMRSGDIHANVQHDFVFHGNVLVWILKADGSTQKTLYSDHDYIAIPAYTPHIFEFITDTVLAEWWDGAGPFHAWYYEPYRSIVEASFTTATFSTTKRGGGSFSLYKLVSPPMEASARNTYLQEIMHVSSSLLFQNHKNSLLLCWTITGMAIGLSLGYIMGRQRRF